MELKGGTKDSKHPTPCSPIITVGRSESGAQSQDSDARAHHRRSKDTMRQQHRWNGHQVCRSHPKASVNCTLQKYTSKQRWQKKGLLEHKPNINNTRREHDSISPYGAKVSGRLARHRRGTRPRSRSSSYLREARKWTITVEQRHTQGRRQ